MKPRQLDLALGELHPLARALLGLQRTWTRGMPEGLEVRDRIVHTCDLLALLDARARLLERQPPFPFADPLGG